MGVLQMISITGILITVSTVVGTIAILVWLKKSSDLLKAISKDMEILQQQINEIKKPSLHN